MKFLYLVLILSVYLVHVLSTKLTEVNIDELVTKFKSDIESHIDEVLAFDELKQMIETREGDLGIVPINGSQVFEDLFLGITVKYNEVVSAVQHLKTVFEANTTTTDDGPVAPPIDGIPPPLVPSSMKCCCTLGPGMFDVKLRDYVHNEECYGNQDKELEFISKTSFKDAMKDNYMKHPSISWQYFADSDGHYIQYPGSNRYCDKMAPSTPNVCDTINSPLTEKLYAEKLGMAHKNVVIILDNSLDDTTPDTNNIIQDAAHQILDTLTPNDKVNLVTFKHSNDVDVPNGCQDGLFVATVTNIKLLKQYIQQTAPIRGVTKLITSLQKTYQLLYSDNTGLAVSRSRRNIIIMLLQGQSHVFSNNTSSLLQMIVEYQQKLVPKAQHLIYTLGKPSTEDEFSLLEIADQNNLKLMASNGSIIHHWPKEITGSGTPVGPVGVLSITDNRSMYPSQVGLYYQQLPPLSNTNNDITTIIPVTDTKYGLGLTLAVPVSDSNNHVVGVVATEASLATVFSDLINLHVGVNSYAFVVDSNHGHVLLHPKLNDPSETMDIRTIFPKLDLVEPSLTVEQQKIILNAHSNKPVKFEAQVQNIHPEISGELVTARDGSLSPVTIYCQNLAGTSVTAVLVLFQSDVEEPKFRKPVDKISLHGVYHRIDKLLGHPRYPDNDEFCHLYGDHFLSYKQSAVKFAPDVFNDPEVYKYSDESIDMVSQLQMFITTGTKTDYIKSSLQDLLLLTLEATDGLDLLWTNHSKHVVERFYGSSDGIFRIYPGSPMLNTFDHRDTDWYKRSIAFPDFTMYHLGKFGFLTDNNVVIISRAVTSNIGIKRLQGVVGITVTSRFLTSQLIDSTGICSSKWCHILDSSGQILDTISSTGKHITEIYPWLSERLLSTGILKQEWCTMFSDGKHKMIYTLEETASSDIDNIDACLQYSLHNISNTNLFILVLEDRVQFHCDDHRIQVCSTCQSQNRDSNYQSLQDCEICDYNTTMSKCQCPCVCNTDFDQCHGQFKTHVKDFPCVNCFNPPEFTTEFLPGPPGPIEHLNRCPIPCVAIEHLDTCSQLNHCKLSDTYYKTCIWKSDEELKNISDISRFFPTMKPPFPPVPSRISTIKHTPSQLTSNDVPTMVTITSPKQSTLSSTDNKPITQVQVPTIESLTSKSPTPSSPVSVSPHTVSSRLSSAAHVTSDISTITVLDQSTTQVPVQSTSLVQEISTHETSDTTTSLIASSNYLTGNTATSSMSSVNTKSQTESITDVTYTSFQNTKNEPKTTQLTDILTIVKTTHNTPDVKLSTPHTSVSGATEDSTHHNTSKHLNKGSEPSDTGLSRGDIAAIVIGILVLLIILMAVGIKIYSVKFHRRGTNGVAAKYSPSYDGSVFLQNLGRMSENISNSSSTNVPYQEMDR